MLTKLSVKGFKNLVDTTIEFGPYTCIAGPNAVGKSNLFDAIEFLSLLADHPFLEAARRLRPSGEKAPDPKTLFTLSASGEPFGPMTLEAEILVGDDVEDEFGQRGRPRSTLLKYSIELRHVPSSFSGRGRLGGIELIREELAPISKGDAHLHLRWPHSAKDFRQSAVQNRRFSGPYVSTEVQDGVPTILVHADGGSRGKPRRSPVEGASRTIVSGAVSADEPTMLAVRQEMRSWRKLAFEPSSLRAPDDLYAPSLQISATGSHTAAALWRLGQTDPDVDSLVAANLSELADVRRVRVATDPARETLSVEAQLGNGPYLPARSLSEGTLRFLALSIIETDPSFLGLICMEEPENGIHPAKIPAMVGLLKRLAIDAQFAPDSENPLRQVIVNTHSPELVMEQSSEDLLIAWPVSYHIDGEEVEGVEFYPMLNSWRTKRGDRYANAQSVASYLRDPRKSPVWQELPLPLEDWR